MLLKEHLLKKNCKLTSAGFELGSSYEKACPLTTWPCNQMALTKRDTPQWENFVCIERLDPQAKICKKTLHSHDVAREADSM